MKRILVVEDSAAVRALLVRTLEAEYDVIVANDGLSGWLLASAEPHPDLIVTDVEMPRLNGISMVRRLKTLESAAQVPIIFLTSHDRPEEVVFGMKSGARHYLTKPFHPEDVLRKVHKLLPP